MWILNYDNRQSPILNASEFLQCCYNTTRKILFALNTLLYVVNGYVWIWRVVEGERRKNFFNNRNALATVSFFPTHKIISFIYKLNSQNFLRDLFINERVFSYIYILSCRRAIQLKEIELKESLAVRFHLSCDVQTTSMSD